MGQWHGAVDELVEPEQTAVLVIDVQQAFTAIPELYPPLDPMLPRLAIFLDAAREARATVVNIRIVVPAEAFSTNWQRQFAPGSKPSWLLASRGSASTRASSRSPVT